MIQAPGTKCGKRAACWFRFGVYGGAVLDRSGVNPDGAFSAMIDETFPDSPPRSDTPQARPYPRPPASASETPAVVKYVPPSPKQMMRSPMKPAVETPLRPPSKPMHGQSQLPSPLVVRLEPTNRQTHARTHTRVRTTLTHARLAHTSTALDTMVGFGLGCPVAWHCLAVRAASAGPRLRGAVDRDGTLLATGNAGLGDVKDSEDVHLPSHAERSEFKGSEDVALR